MTLGVTRRKVTFKGPDIKNAAGGASFVINDASQRLLHIVGAAGFNEPRNFYTIPETKNPAKTRAFKNSFNSTRDCFILKPHGAMTITSA